ncbi:MAG: amidohydrolase [Candidatus Izimaplasma sp.]|nr:amidohydrolase [Candidatus Izimaplasma bacterium]
MKISGFIDSHLHMLGLGYYSSLVDLSQSKSIKDIQSILKNKLAEKIIIGKGWNQDQFIEKRNINKSDLNEVSNEIPIVLTRACGHVMVVNDRMLELANIDETTPQVCGGDFSYSDGIFREKALILIKDKLNRPTKEEIKKYFIKANQILIKNGITSVASDDFLTFDIPFQEIINIIEELYDNNLLQVRITEQVNLPKTKFLEFIKKGFVNKRFNNKFKMGPLKILADGSLGARTAYLSEPYSDDLNNYGINTFSDDELYEMVHLADKNHMDVAIHTIGDEASQQAIDAIKKSLQITKRENHHHALVHAQLTRKDQILEMKKYNIGAIVQPIFINTDIKIIDGRLGNRKSKVYLFKTMDKLLPLGFSTDAPVEPVNPFYNLYSALTYKSLKYPEYPSLNPSQCFTLKEALKAYTGNNLQFVYERKSDLSDYIIIDKDINKTDINKLKDIKVLQTYIDGKLVYSRNKKTL